MTSPGSPDPGLYTFIWLQMGPTCPRLRPGLSSDSCLALPETPPVVILAIRREPHLQQLARAEGLPHALQEALLCIQDGDGSLVEKETGHQPGSPSPESLSAPGTAYCTSVSNAWQTHAP